MKYKHNIKMKVCTK